MITKYLKTAAAMCVAAMLTPFAATAVPAYSGLMKVTQADGTELLVKLRGDETHHIYLTEDDYLLEERDGNFYYANVDASGKLVGSSLQARSPRQRTSAERDYLSRVNMPAVLNAMTREAQAAKEMKASLEASMSMSAVPVGTNHMADDDEYQGYGLFPNSSFPIRGEQKGLVVLVEYQDVKFNDSYDPYDYFSRMCNETGFNTYGGTGSARDFFLEQSGGQFSPTFDVYGPVTLPKNMAYYGGNSYGGNDAHASDMVVDALDILDPDVDFSQYDADGDGNIDNVFVFYAGRGEATGGGANTVWPHQWDVTYGGHNKVYDGVKAGRYACSNEWETMYSDGPRPDGVGTFVHEFSHVMGLPDLYATGYTSAFTPGEWSAMDYGPYNNEGRTPPLYGIFERNALGWMKPEEITGALNGTLRSIGHNEGYIINTHREQEFFLLENRQKVSWDSYIPGNGMLVWHIFYSGSVWTSNRVNNDPSLQYVDIEEADGTQGDNSRANDVFPGLQGKFTSFTDNTNPSMMTWQKKPVNKPITHIALNDSVITFKACGGIPDINATEALETSALTPGGFTATWAPSAETDKDVAYLFSVYTKDNEGVRTYAKGHRKQLVEGTSVTIDDLEPLTHYFWIVQVLDRTAQEESFESNELDATTLEPTFAYMRPVLTEATDIEEDSFTANWEEFAGATAYTLSVYTRSLGDDLEVYECGFDQFVSPEYTLPEGWTTNVAQSYTSLSYSGKARPSMRLQQDGDYVQTCEYAVPVRRISFWHRGITKNEVNYIQVSVNSAGTWIDLDRVDIYYEKEGKTVVIDNLPDFVQAVRIEFKRSVSGTVALDDVVIECAEEFVHTPVAGFEAFDAGNATGVTVTGLSSGITYYYTVTATDGTISTRPSFEGYVTTSGVNAIENVASDAAADVTLSGRRLTAGESVVVYDFSGRQIAALAAGRSMTLAPGLYIVKGETSAAKIAVR